MTTEKLLIVGCGDLGRRLGHQLDKTRYQVTGLRRHPPKPTDVPSSEAADLAYVGADAGDPDQLQAVLKKGYDVIVVTMTPSERTDDGYRRAYVETCQNLSRALRHCPAPRLLVYVSSTSVYGQSNGEWIDENSETSPSRVSGEHLLTAERVIAESGLPHCIVRFSGIYGPGRDRLINQIRQGRAKLSRRYTNRIHADDCAGVLAHLIERHREGQTIDSLYLASDDEPAPQAEVVNWLAMQMKVDEARFAPDDMGPRGHKRCDNSRLRGTGFEFRFPNYRTGYSALLSIPPDA